MTILYCGDTSLNGAASYLAGLMTAWSWGFEYVPSDQRVTMEQATEPRGLFIFSDYPASQLTPEVHEAIAAQVRQGAGLLMIGGWESFHGLGGDWDGTVIGDLLPVIISPGDDRVNFDQPTMLRALNDDGGPHAILKDLPWTNRPPTIGGLNKFRPKPDADLLLAGISFSARVVATHPWIQAAEGFVENWVLPPKVKETLSSMSPFRTPYPGDIALEVAGVYPVLAVGSAGQGRTAAFASDVAPHWVGGFVDWGETRVTGQAPSGNAIEVGYAYAQFWKQLLGWTGRLGV